MLSEIKPGLMESSEIDFSDTKVLSQPPQKLRKSPIIVTLSDANITPVDIQKLMEAGMNVAIFKTAYSTSGDKIRLLGKVDKAAKTLCTKHGVLDWPVATSVELKTCIVKTGLLEKELDNIILQEKSDIILTYSITEYDRCNGHKIFVDNPYLTADVKVGMEISINQDEIILHCTEIADEKSIKCIVTKSGKLSNMCTVSVRACNRSRPYITKKDLQIIKFALEYQVDMIVINYARHKETLKKIKQYIGKKYKRPILISGVCTPEGLDNIDDILKESDGILFSREFLAYELDSSQRYRMIQIQKLIGGKCLKAGKPFYISGGVFRQALVTGDYCEHEISDVTNALLDGVTGFVLKDCDNIELAVNVIHCLNDLCCSVEPYTNAKTDFRRIIEEIKMPINAAEASVMSCAAVAIQTKARVIVLPTVTGRTAKALLCLRPCCIVITVSNRPRINRLLHTYRCVVPLMYNGAPHRKWHDTVQARINFAIEHAVKNSWLGYGDTYLSLQRWSESNSYCDTVRVWTVSIWKKAAVECPDDEDNIFK